MSPGAKLWVSVLSDFVITAGSTLLGALTEHTINSVEVSIPHVGVWVVAGVTGLIAAAKELRQAAGLPNGAAK